MVIGGRPVMDPGDEESRPIRRKSAEGSNTRGNAGDRGSGGDRGRKDER